MSEERKKSGLAFWATVVVLVAVAALVVYPLSVGPAVWLVEHDVLPEDVLEIVYYPISLGPRPICKAIDWYASFWR